MKGKNYKQPIFINEVMERGSIVEQISFLRDFDVYKNAGISTIRNHKNEIVNYGFNLDNYHFEAKEREMRIFLAGLLVSIKQIGVIDANF